MSIIRRFTYTEATPTAQYCDSTSGNLWVAYGQDVDGNCVLKNLVATDISQIYASIDIAVDEITAIVASGSYLYLSYDDSALLGGKFSLANPYATATDIAVPSGITEKAIGVLVRGSYLYFLIPGEISGTNAKIVKTNLSGVYQSTIDLTTITNATSFILDTNSEIQVITYTAPVQLVRVYDIDTTPQYSVTNITD